MNNDALSILRFFPEVNPSAPDKRVCGNINYKPLLFTQLLIDDAIDRVRLK
ncbi:MAG: hypothetical protein ACQETR_10945 [Thermodesulfobacteriota bacterium]